MQKYCKCINNFGKLTKCIDIFEHLQYCKNALIFFIDNALFNYQKIYQNLPKNVEKIVKNCKRIRESNCLGKLATRKYLLWFLPKGKITWLI